VGAMVARRKEIVMSALMKTRRKRQTGLTVGQAGEVAAWRTSS
jgi:hypothetical protein